MSGGYCAMSEHDDRIEELNGAIDSALERLKDLTDPLGHTSGMDADEIKHELREITAILHEVR